MRALSIASTGMLAQQTNVEVIANNLANMNTTGFKEQRAEFAGPALPECADPGRPDLGPGHLCARAASSSAPASRPPRPIASPPRAISPAPPIPMTWRSRAPGYFRIQQADGTDAYTRAGNFSLSPQGQIVTQDGMLVQPGIAIPANTTSVTINAQGQVNATVAGNTTPQTVGQLELTAFPTKPA